ncbi:MAG: DSD1 family PLP-dependent enzyme [Candidatus Latescibacteria bacterium]|nr:DSD1 family PLP-dependent enzyme [Candidatus Latescibacterota bacterium]
MPQHPHPAIGLQVTSLDTPSLLVDLDRFERNVAAMAAYCERVPVNLRPHAKTHKCPEIARRQVEAGAIGITCAKVGEAEVLVEGGLSDILIANEIVGPQKIERLMALARRADMMVAVDHPRNVEALSDATVRAGARLRVLVDVDIGMGRCGVPPGDAAVELAQHVARVPGLVFAGVMGYEGHTVDIPDRSERRQKTTEAVAHLLETKDRIERLSIPVEIVSGGGTGTYDITGPFGVTELQAGSYIFMDTTYRKVLQGFEHALFVLATVISRPTARRVITDTGVKTFAGDYGQPAFRDIPDATLESLSEEHGNFLLNEDSDVPELGEKVILMPGHCCTTANLHEEYYVIQDGRVVDVWPIAARGKSR